MPKQTMSAMALMEALSHDGLIVVIPVGNAEPFTCKEAEWDKFAPHWKIQCAMRFMELNYQPEILAVLYPADSPKWRPAKLHDLDGWFTPKGQ